MEVMHKLEACGGKESFETHVEPSDKHELLFFFYTVAKNRCFRGDRERKQEPCHLLNALKQ